MDIQEGIFIIMLNGLLAQPPHTIQLVFRCWFPWWATNKQNNRLQNYKFPLRLIQFSPDEYLKRYSSSNPRKIDRRTISRSILIKNGHITYCVYLFLKKHIRNRWIMEIIKWKIYLKGNNLHLFLCIGPRCVSLLHRT